MRRLVLVGSILLGLFLGVSAGNYAAFAQVPPPHAPPPPPAPPRHPKPPRLHLKKPHIKVHVPPHPKTPAPPQPPQP